MTFSLKVPDNHNPSKVHVFRLYKDGHVTYNQEISGSLFYSRFSRINKNHGYYSYLDEVIACPTRFARFFKENI